MGIVQIAGLALLSVALILCLKELRASLALPTRLAAALLLFGAAFALYVPVLERMRALFSLSGAADFATPLLRAAGIAIICELAVSFCRDLGENTVANGVLLRGRRVAPCPSSPRMSNRNVH